MPSSRPTRALSALTGVAGVGAFGLWYQLFRRPLPRTSGRMRLRGLEAPVDVVRDRFGVPHIRSRGAIDLAFSIGFCHGQDRLWQLEFFRRATAGRLSRVRRAGHAARRPADAHARPLPHRRARGDRARRGGAHDGSTPTRPASTPRSRTPRALPIEFQILRLEPEPWSLADLLASAKLLALGLSTNWEMELFRAQLVRDAGAEAAARLEPQYPRANPVVVTPGEAYGGRGVDIAEQIARVKEADRPHDPRRRLEQLGRVGRAVGHRAGRCSRATRTSARRSPGSGTRPTSAATSTACAEPRFPTAPTRSTGRRATPPGASRT